MKDKLKSRWTSKVEVSSQEDSANDFESDEKFDTPQQQQVELTKEETPGRFEGDIIPDDYVKEVVTSGSSKKSLFKRGYFMNKAEHRMWTNGVVYYVFNKDLPSAKQKIVDEAIAHIEKKTCIRFTKDTNPNGWIEIQPGKGCSSFIGRTGKKPQGITLEEGCYTGTTIHEFVHALGFFHEQSRTDRDKYVTIKDENILKGKEFNFKKYTHVLEEKHRTPYDYHSIMHYPKNAFSANGEDTIVPKDTNAVIGVRTGLSDIDIKELNTLYGCVPCSTNVGWGCGAAKLFRHFKLACTSPRNTKCAKTCGFYCRA